MPIYSNSVLATSNEVRQLDWKTSCRVRSSASVTIASPGAAIDGVTMAPSDRCLLTGQATASQNGIWTFNGAAAAMTRPDDFNLNSEVTSGATTFISEGSSAGENWSLVTADDISVDVTSITFSQTGGPGAVEVVTATWFVDVARVDSYTETGSINKPFKTVAGAFSAAYASALRFHIISIAPGVYSEDATLTADPGDAYAVVGGGREAVTTVRSITIDPQAGADSINIQLQHIRLGDSVGATQSGLIVGGGGGPGSTFIKCNETDIFSPINGINAMTILSTGGSGAISFQLETGEVGIYSGVTGAAAIDAARGSIWGRFEVTSEGVDAVQLSGNATFTLNNSNIKCTGGGNLNCVSHSGSGGVTLSNVALTPTGDGHGVTHSGIGQTVSMGNAIFIQGAGLGNIIDNPLGAAAIGIVSTEIGSMPGVTAGATILLAPSAAVSYDPTTSGLVSTEVQGAIDEVVGLIPAGTSRQHTLSYGGVYIQNSYKSLSGIGPDPAIGSLIAGYTEGVILFDGTITLLSAITQSIGSNYTFTIFLNGATTAVTVGTGGLGSVVGAVSVAVLAGDTVSISQLASGLPLTNCSVQILIEG